MTKLDDEAEDRNQNNALLSVKRRALEALEAAVVEETTLKHKLAAAERRVTRLKGEVGRAACRRDVARTKLEQAEGDFMHYRVKRAERDAAK